ncbi:MAG: hypothetical protein JXR88_00425 [Clostridia bacterium]|nr:hypothetical protein [Clostridia bacterium]
MTFLSKSKKTIMAELNNMIDLAKAYFFYFFNWGFFYWSAGYFTFKYKFGDCYST